MTAGTGEAIVIGRFIGGSIGIATRLYVATLTGACPKSDSRLGNSLGDAVGDAVGDADGDAVGDAGGDAGGVGGCMFGLGETGSAIRTFPCIRGVIRGVICILIIEDNNNVFLSTFSKSA